MSSPQERNYEAVKRYREKLGKQEFLKQVLLQRIRKGHIPKPSTLAKYGLKD